MTKKMNPLLKPENRTKFIQEAIQAISDKQNKVILEANKIIGDVTTFEQNMHERFESYRRS